MTSEVGVIRWMYKDALDLGKVTPFFAERIERKGKNPLWRAKGDTMEVSWLVAREGLVYSDGDCAASKEEAIGHAKALVQELIRRSKDTLDKLENLSIK